MFLHNMNFRLKISSKFMLWRNIKNSGYPLYHFNSIHHFDIKFCKCISFSPYPELRPKFLAAAAAAAAGIFWKMEISKLVIKNHKDKKNWGKLSLNREFLCNNIIFKLECNKWAHSRCTRSPERRKVSFNILRTLFE